MAAVSRATDGYLIRDLSEAATDPIIEEVVARTLPSISIFDDEIEHSYWKELRFKNKALYIPPEDFQELVEFFRKYIYGDGFTAEDIEQGTLLERNYLHRAGNRLTKVPAILGYLTQLQNVSLSHNKLTKLSINVGWWPSLKALHLDNNQLTQLSDHIGQWTELEKLHLDHNRLTKLPNSIRKLTKLRELWLDDNKLTSLPAGIKQLGKLQQLDLGHNELTSFPEGIESLENLQRLDLCKNRLISLPASVGFQALKKLDLGHNHLKNLPPSFGQLPSLEKFALCGNELTELPDTIGSLANLTSFGVSHNQLTTLPASFNQLTRLDELWLNHNLLTSFPESLLELKALQLLDLSENQLTSLPDDLSAWGVLEVLDFSENRLTRLSASIGELTTLHWLLLDGNQLTHLPDSMEQLRNLTKIKLSSNQVEYLFNIGEWENLEELWVDDNCLASLPPSIGNLHKLTRLEVQRNPLLSTLPMSLSNCTRINDITLRGTAIPQEDLNTIFRAIQQAKNSPEEAAQLSAKLNMWKKIAGITEVWPELTVGQQKVLLKTWLLRLEMAADFSNCQKELAQAVCKILTTVFTDEVFKEQFFNLIVADLERCGDRAAMSLNVVHTEWRLHQLRADAGLEEIVSLLVPYGRTHQLRKIIDRDHGHKREGVEHFLYAETEMQKVFELLTVVKTMSHRPCGADVNLEAVKQELAAFSDAELIYELAWWQQYVESRDPKGVAEAREAASEQLDPAFNEGKVEKPLFKGPEEEARWLKEEYNRRVYLPLTIKYLTRISHPSLYVPVPEKSTF